MFTCHVQVSDFSNMFTTMQDLYSTGQPGFPLRSKVTRNLESILLVCLEHNIDSFLSTVRYPQ